MWVLGGAFNLISNEVDVYDPVGNSWSLGPAFTTARRNFPTDTDGTTPHLAGRWLRQYHRPIELAGNLLQRRGRNSNTNTDSVGNCDSNGDSNSDRDRHSCSNSNA